MNSRNLLIHLKLLIVAAIWGGGWVAGRVLALDAPPLTAALIRYLVEIYYRSKITIHVSIQNCDCDWVLFNIRVSGSFHVWNEIHCCW